ncbi:MAG: hypothetical protein GX640_04105 [Fibrobacter sp.]|nr:hypothetical protein [Fibrobacter sp.]
MSIKKIRWRRLFLPASLLLVSLFSSSVLAQIASLSELEAKASDIAGAAWLVSKVVVYLCAAWLLGTGALEVLKQGDDKMRAIGKIMVAGVMVLTINVFPSLYTFLTGKSLNQNSTILGTTKTTNP